MTTWQFLLSAWHWDLFALTLGMAAIVLRFAVLRAGAATNQPSVSRHPVPAKQRLALVAGITVLGVALISPVRVLAESYLFSAHMLQHLLLLLVVPPLLLASLPYLSQKGLGPGVWSHHPGGMKEGCRGSRLGETPGAPTMRDCIPEGCQKAGLHSDAYPSGTPPGCESIAHRDRGSPPGGDPRLPSASPPGWKGASTSKAQCREAPKSAGSDLSCEPPKNERAHAWIPLAWLAGVGAMWLWHAPTLCDAATTSQAVFRLQIVSLVGLGLLFWLPICGPVLAWRLSPLTGIIYLFTACFACTLLGIYITFTPVTVCSIYAHPVDRFGILPLIYSQWGLTPAVDQRIGGLMMWVPACSIYLSGILTLLARWYGDAEEPAEAAATVAGMKPKEI